MDIQEALLAYRGILFAVAGTISVILFYKLYEEAIKIFWIGFCARFPVIGTNARYARKPQILRQDGWLDSEKNICSAYGPYYKRYKKNAGYYDNCKSYLSKSGETGRKPLGTLGWLGILGLVLAESVGFAYILSGYITAFTASESTQRLITAGTSLVISFLLVWLTHSTGKQLHQNELIGKARKWWRDENTRSPMRDSDQEISIEHDHLDDDEPRWRKILTRVPHNENVTKRYTTTIITVFAVLAIAIGATYIRALGIDQAASEIVMNGPASELSSQGGSGGIFDDLPSEVTAENNQAVQQGEKDIVANFKKAAWTAYILLGFIFVILQVIGVLLGYYKSFAGIESEKAHKITSKFEDRDDFIAYYEQKRTYIALEGQRILTDLQSRLASVVKNTHNDEKLMDAVDASSTRTFLAYLELTDQEHEDRIIKDDERQLRQSQRNQQNISDRHNTYVQSQLTESTVGQTPEDQQQAALEALQKSGIDVDSLTDEELFALIDKKVAELQQPNLPPQLNAAERLANRSKIA